MAVESGRKIGWFGAGVPSAVACFMMLEQHPDAIVAYCETGSEDPDNDRFIADVEERLFHRKVLRLRSLEYDDTWDVWEKRSYISGPDGAPCTRALKVVPRLEFQHSGDVNFFGYTADSAELKRARAFAATWTDMALRFPLIEAGLTEASCHALIEGAGIERPRTYRLGFRHANCIPCGKATSPGYWALVRRHYPEKFARMAALSRKLGARLAIVGREKVGDKMVNVRVFIDEIPADQSVADAIMPQCDLMCQLVALAPGARA